MKLSLSPEQFVSVLSYSIPIGILFCIAIFILAAKTHKIDIKNLANLPINAIIIGLPIGVLFVLIPLWLADFLSIKAKIIITLMSFAVGVGSTYSIHLLAKAFSLLMYKRKKETMHLDNGQRKDRQ